MLSALSVAEFCRKEAVRFVCSSLLLASVLWRSPRSRDFSLMGRVCPPRRGTASTPELPPPPPAPPSAMLSVRRVPVTPPAGFFGKGGGSFLSSWHGDGETWMWGGNGWWIYLNGLYERSPMQRVENIGINKEDINQRATNKKVKFMWVMGRDIRTSSRNQNKISKRCLSMRWHQENIEEKWRRVKVRKQR